MRSSRGSVRNAGGGMAEWSWEELEYCFLRANQMAVRESVVVITTVVLW